MKKCTWCGKEYGDDLERCLIDGEPLAGGKARPAESSQTRLESPVETSRCNILRSAANSIPLTEKPQWIDFNQLEGAFEWVEGYSRPNWKLIRNTIKETVENDNLGSAWAEAVLQWTQQLCLDLGGQYIVRSSPQFVLVSAQGTQRVDGLLQFAESTLERIYAWLKDAAWQWVHGPHVILLFDDEEDYYQYVAYFYRDGIHPASGGCLIHKDYVHMAIPYDGRSIHRTLAHELVHNRVVHLPLPLWLNEGLAIAFERSSADQKSHILDGDLRERHFAFWNHETIQRFWAGVSFHQPADSHMLSYSLAEILMHLLFSERNELPAFVKAAHRSDAGQTAALDVLNADLGQVAGTFLGPGDWRPNRKAILGCWNAARLTEKDDCRPEGLNRTAKNP